MVGKLTPDNMVSASRIPQLLGLSPYATQNELLAEMIDRDEGNEPDAWEGNELTMWGDIHEPVIMLETAKRLNSAEYDAGIKEPFFHDSLRLACSLDGLGMTGYEIKTDPAKGITVIGDSIVPADTPIIIECKTTQAAPEDTPPPWRGPRQLQAQMMCHGAQWGAVAVLYRGSTLRITVYPADPAQQNEISAAVNEFEQRRTTKDWYPLVSPEDGNTAFARVDDGAPPLDVSDDDVQTAIETLLEAKRLKREADDAIKDAETVIKEYMGNHEEASTIVDGKRVIVKWPMRKTRAQPEKVVPAKPAASVRQNTLTVKELGDA